MIEMSGSVAVRRIRRAVVKMTLASVCDEQLMIWIYANADRRAKPLVRQMHAPVVADRYAGRDDSLPDMTVGIGKIAGVTAILGRGGGLEPAAQPGTRVNARYSTLTGRAKSPGARTHKMRRGHVRYSPVVSTGRRNTLS
jgi:hypothetical protein